MRATVALLALLGALAAVPALAGTEAAWDGAYDAASTTRFIPVELWTGADWDGTRAIRMAPAELQFGPSGHKSIKGPFAWTDPRTRQTFQVYERLNAGKRQLFTITNDGTGLGRVLDSRYRESCTGEVKFPLGYWKQGEVRTYTLSCEPGARVRPLVVTITDIDFRFDGVPHSLRFHWLLNEGKGRGTDMTYVYSPGRGLVHVHGNE